MTVLTGKGGVDLPGDSRAHRLGAFGPGALQELWQQPATDAPGKTEVAGQCGRRQVEGSIDIDLLVGIRAVAVVFAHLLRSHRLHRGENLAGQLAAAYGVEGQGGPGRLYRRHQVGHEAVTAAVQYMRGALRAQQGNLLLAPHDIDQGNIVRLAEAIEHLPEVTGSRGVHQGTVPLHHQGFPHSQGGHRVDEAGRALLRGGARLQRQALQGIHAAILTEHFPAEDPDGAPQQCLGLGGIPRGNHRSRALVAGRQGLPDTRLHQRQGPLRQGQGDLGTLRRALDPGARRVRRTEEQKEIRGIDRCRANPQHDFLRPRARNRLILQPQGQGSLGIDPRTQLQSRVAHGIFPLIGDWHGPVTIADTVY